MAKCIWNEKRKQWVLQGYKNNQKKTFYSRNKGKQGERECYAEYYKWLELIDNPQARKVDEAFTEYLEYYSKFHKVGTTDKLNQTYKYYLKDKFGNKTMSTLAKSDWQNHIDNLYAERNLSYSTTSKIISLIKHFNIYCASKGYMLDQNVPQFLHNPAPKTKPIKRALYPDELRELLTTDIDNWYIDIFRFLVFTGLRRGEVCALKTDRDYLLPYLHVRENVVFISTGVELTTPKSGKEREEYLNQNAINCINAHAEKKLNKNFESEYLFVSATGQRINPKMLSRNWRTIRKALNFGSLTLHELRHTFATYTSKELNIEELKQILGHSKHMDTKGTYVHEIPLTEKEKELKLKLDKEKADKIDSVFDIF